jgi:nucleotide-binding universal stress UspA family protein
MENIMLPLATILHPTDFSEHSEFAFRLACALASDYKARLIVLHVISPSEASYGGLLEPTEKGPDNEEVKRSLREMEKSHWRLPCPTTLLVEVAKEKLRQLESQADRVRVESQVMEGDPVDLILRAAKETNCDIIVMGTHGRTALARLLVGSVAESVLRKAPCPVLTSKAFLEPMRITGESEKKAESADSVI